MNVGHLIWTWLALMLLLAATIGASFLPIGVWRQVINLVVAGAKASLILWIFMKLRDEPPLVRLKSGAAGVLLLVLAAMLTADYLLRPDPSSKCYGFPGRRSPRYRGEAPIGTMARNTKRLNSVLLMISAIR
ncbi:cytochrome C oxidase subunit IV family protein [Rhizorhabdus argentea]|uniref:cytochrome C oxidase subunit IV family protein n=1 Tax=Rhizorhabdus argentea TaxID=1387174 RepID=UPI0030ED8C73